MKALIIQTAFLGDVVLTLPLAQEIKRQNPSSKITALVIPACSDVVSNCPAIDKIVLFDKRKEHRSLFSLFALGAELRREKYDVVFCPHRSMRSAILTFLAKPKKSVGFDKSAAAFLFKKVVRYNSDIHEVSRNLSLLGNYPNNQWKILPQINSESAKEKIGNKLKNWDENKIAGIAPGSVWETKKYPVELYVEIAKQLVSNGWKIAVIGGKEDRELGKVISGAVGEAWNFCGDLSIVESIELLRRCDFLISNDSAPTHLAMAADIPVITIFCSTIPDFGFYPYNEKSVSLSYNDLDCKPCGIHGKKVCPTGTFDCALKLKPARVLTVINNLFPNRQ